MIQCNLIGRLIWLHYEQTRHWSILVEELYLGPHRFTPRQGTIFFMTSDRTDLEMGQHIRVLFSFETATAIKPEQITILSESHPPDQD